MLRVYKKPVIFIERDCPHNICKGTGFDENNSYLCICNPYHPKNIEKNAQLKPQKPKPPLKNRRWVAGIERALKDA
jgi:hypothetical protein